MSKKLLRIATLLGACTASGLTPAFALDGKVVLDQLVKKGVLSPEEADAIVKKDLDAQKASPKAPVPEAKQKDAFDVKLGGRVQVQGKYFTRDSHGDSSDSGQTPVSGFELRRFNLDAEAALPHGFSLFGSIEANVGNGGGNNASSTGYAIFIDKAGVAYDAEEYGKFTGALQKARYALEEYTSASNLYTIERSAVSNYFANTLQLGGRHIGFFWESRDNAKTGGWQFGAGMANAYQGAFNAATTPQAENYAPAFYGNVSYVALLNADSKLQFDLNLAYTEANINAMNAGVNAAGATPRTVGLPGNTGTNADFDARTAGIEFVAKYTAGRFTAIGDFMSAYIVNGRFANGAGFTATNAGVRADSAMPFGCTATLAYRVTDEIEPVVQFGYVDTDGRGTPESTFRDLSENGNSVSPGTGLAFSTYDRAETLFVGANWYITPKSLKLTAGFDSAHFEGRANNATVATRQAEEVYGGRLQLQALF